MMKAVIFDMDGLLIDSEPFWRASHRKVLAGMGYDVSEDDVRQMAGKGTLQVVALWRQRFGITSCTDQELADKVVDMVMTMVTLSGVAMPGALALIKMLNEQHIPMALASSSNMTLINVVVDRLAIRPYMQAIHSGADEERSKPFPDVFLSTARTLGVGPVDCLVFEDSLNGVKAAKAAAMKCIAVPEIPYERAAFEAANPDKIVTSLAAVTWAQLQSI